MATQRGFFEQYVNSRAASRTRHHGELVEQIISVARVVVAGANIEWSGSQRKGTDIDGSDFDLCLCSSTPVTKPARREFARELQARLGRPTSVQSHAVRIQGSPTSPRVDIAFQNASFGNRPLADPTPFVANPARQTVARALKIWNRRPHATRLPGWVVEAIVVKIDASTERDPLRLFDIVIDWLAQDHPKERILALLRGYSQPAWNEANNTSALWGRVEAIRCDARALQSARSERDAWSTPLHAGEWLTRSAARPVKIPGSIVSDRGATSSINRSVASGRKETPMTDTKKPTPNDQRSNVKNPNNPAHKSAQDNRANQLNPQHAASKPATNKSAPSKPRSR